jgi:uncharacterized membrane protein HdeD (DUF308 family)
MGEPMNFSTELDTLEQHLAKTKSDAKAAAKESRDKVKERIDQAQADVEQEAKDAQAGALRVQVDSEGRTHTAFTTSQPLSNQRGVATAGWASEAESSPIPILEKHLMLSSLTRNWWTVALRSTLALIFGVVAFVWPGITFEALVLLFGAYAFVDGILVLGFGLMAASEGEQWWPLVLSGILGIGLSVVTFARPGAVGLALVYVVGFWAIVTGLLEIVAAIRLRDVVSGEWMMALSGALSILFGVLVVAQPDSGAVALVYLFGFYAILAGISQISLGFRLRGLAEDVRKAVPQTVSSTSH